MMLPPTPDEDQRAATGSLAELALTVVRTQLAAMLAHESGTRAGADPEALHDMRVATRRLRAALKIFAGALPPEAETIRQELAWLGRGLAAVRDLDVQLAHLREWRTTLPEPDRPGLDALSMLCADRRLKARQDLLALLDSERYVQLVASLQQLLDIRSVMDASGPLAAEAPDLITRAYRQLRKLGDKLDERSASTDLHAVRIRAKRLRYAVEFVTDAYGRPARRFVQRVVDLQDLLGDHQDAQVARDRLRAMAAEDAGNLPESVVFVMGELAQRYADDAAELRSRFVATYRRATGRRWRKLRRALKVGQRACRRDGAGPG